MRPPRVRISTLIGLVLACALGMAALRRPGPEVEQAAFSATVLALILAALRAVHRPGGARAFWSGFALAGGAYLALSIIPATEGRLATTRAAGLLADRMGAAGAANGPFAQTFTYPVSNGNPQAFLADTVQGTISSDVVATAPAPRSFTYYSTDRPVGASGTDFTFSFGVQAGATPTLDRDSFVRVCHDLFAWICGAAVGMISRAWWMGRRRGRAWDRLARGKVPLP